jgi:copper transport protein
MALAHAQLVQSDPMPKAALQSLPAAVTLLFTEAVTPAGPGIRVFSPSGNQVAGLTEVRGAVLTAPLTSRETGTFVVAWQVFAADTHPSRGSFSFDVARASSNPYSALLDASQIGTSTPFGLAMQALARWVHFAGFALAFGVVAYRVLMRRDEEFKRLVGVGVALLIVAEPMALIAQLASLSFDGDTAIAVLGSNFGRLLGLRLGAVLLLWTLIPTRRSWPPLVIGGVVALLDGLSGHAIPAFPGVGQLLVAIHVSAMGLWVGGLAAFLKAPDPGFGRYAAATFGVTALTGLILAFAHTASFAALMSTEYGWALLLKIGVVTATVITVVLRRRRLELGAAIAVVAAAALLAALPPSR